jgi:hypothetical protein
MSAPSSGVKYVPGTLAAMAELASIVVIWLGSASGRSVPEME